MHRNKGELLENLYRQVACEYFSEIKGSERKEQVIQLLLSLPLSDYTLEQWNYTLTYLFDRTIAAESLEDIKQVLLEELEKTGWQK